MTPRERAEACWDLITNPDDDCDASWLSRDERGVVLPDDEGGFVVRVPPRAEGAP